MKHAPEKTLKDVVSKMLASGKIKGIKNDQEHIDLFATVGAREALEEFGVHFKKVIDPTKEERLFEHHVHPVVMRGAVGVIPKLGGEEAFNELVSNNGLRHVPYKKSVTRSYVRDLYEQGLRSPSSWVHEL